MVHGLIGTPDRLGYTVIGDEVNLAVAARGAEQGVRDVDHRLRADPQSAPAVGPFAFELLDEVMVRGRTTSTRIYKVAAA